MDTCESVPGSTEGAKDSGSGSPQVRQQTHSSLQQKSHLPPDAMSAVGINTDYGVTTPEIPAERGKEI